MATYAIRFIGPVVERARRWSQSSAAEDRPTTPTMASPNSSSAPTTPNHRPILLDSVLEAIDADAGDADAEDTDSEGTLIIVDPPSAPRPQISPSPGTREQATDALGHLPSQLRLLPSPLVPPPEDPAATISPPSPHDQPTSFAKPSLLPGDDGQSVLRRRLIEIAKLEITERERARRMHLLMTEKYNASRRASVMPDPISPPPPDPRMADAKHVLLPQDNPYKLLPADLTQTYHIGATSTSESGTLELGCSHYRRGVKLQCSTCEKWYTCRFCHDESEDHSLVRRETRNMLCMHCSRAQPAQQDCRYCGVRSSRYYCDKCKLWDDDPDKSIYHCSDCGICRIGQGLGKDFFHCKKCGMCMAITLEGEHRCIERSTECDCPICGEYMFTSTSTVVFMACGHSIHHKCYNEHVVGSYRCPTCARTIVNMEGRFRALDMDIGSQPLPDPYKSWRCLISCNDCSARSNVPFHFLGQKCENCLSYNTNQVRILRPEEEGQNSHGDALPAIHHTPTMATSSTSSLSPQLRSPPRLAPTEGDAALENANRAILAASEVIRALDHGDSGLVFDDGWETDDSANFTDANDNDEEDLDSFVKEDDEDEEDDDDDDLIQLTGHP